LQLPWERTIQLTRTPPQTLLTHTQFFSWCPPHQLGLPAHWQIRNLRAPSEHSTWTWIQWFIQCSSTCCCSSDKYILGQLLCLINSCISLNIVMRCIESLVLLRNALKSFS
jgi:hypothetical protein